VTAGDGGVAGNLSENAVPRPGSVDTVISP